MAKIQIPRIFEVALIAATKAYKDIEPLVDYINQLSDNVIRILTNGVSLNDNMDAKRLALDLKDNTATSINVGKVPVAVYLARQVPATPLVTAWSWDIDKDGNLQVTVKFDTPPSSTVNCAFYIHFS